MGDEFISDDGEEIDGWWIEDVTSEAGLPFEVFYPPETEPEGEEAEE